MMERVDEMVFAITADVLRNALYGKWCRKLADGNTEIQEWRGRFTIMIILIIIIIATCPKDR